MRTSKSTTFAALLIVVSMASAAMQGFPGKPAEQLASRPPSRPNIVWISNEDMSPRLGVYGDALARTPVLDRFASQSIRYTNAFTTAPVCAPSRAAIITGMYQTAIGAQHMRTTEDRVPELPGPYLAVPPFYVKAFPEYSARRRLLHDQPRQDGLSVRRAVHHLGRRGAGCALAQPGRQDPAVLLGVQPGGHARESDFSVEPGPERQTGRDQPGCDPGAAGPIRTRRPCAKSSRGCTTTSPTWTRRSAKS